MRTDEELLRAYHEGRCEAAFAELVARHVDLVYSTVLRTVREPQLAQDVAQAVFLQLARKAGSIRQASALAGWLYRVACDQAANAVRAEHRRHRREEEAVKMNATPEGASPVWDELAPLLEEAMQTLARRDQDAVVLRFFRGQSLRQVGEALELSEDAAQKRLSRALERLRDYFARRGVKVSAAALASGLAAHAIHAAPAGVGPAISTAVIASGVALSSPGLLGLTKIGLTNTLVMTTTQKLSVTAVITLMVAAGFFEAHRSVQMRARLREAERRLAPTTAEVDQLRQERDELNTRLQDAQAQIERLQQNTTELARLRGEVVRLRQDAQELAKVRAGANPSANTKVPSSEPVPAELAGRIALLQQSLQQRPERQIPELQFVDEKDWLEAARLVKTESDIDVRKGLSLLRTLAKNKFGLLLNPALVKYTEANNGDLPTDMLQLKPFFTVPVDDAVLQRYELMSAGSTGDPGFNPHQPVIRDKTDARIDPTYDAMLLVSVNGIGGGGGPNTIFPNKPGTVVTITKSDGMTQPKP